MFTNSNWFAFQDERTGDDVATSATSLCEQMDEINLNGTSNGGSNSSDDEVVIGEDEELVVNRNSNNGNPFIEDNSIDKNLETSNTEENSADRSMHESVSVSGVYPFLDSGSLADPSPDLSQKDELEGGSEKAMDQALKEGIVGEAGPLKTQVGPNEPEKENPDQSGSELSEFNDSNYWRVDQEVSVTE